MGAGCCKQFFPTFKFAVIGENSTLVHKVLESTGRLSTKPIVENSGIIEKTLPTPWKFAHIKLFSVDYKKQTTRKYDDGRIIVLDATNVSVSIKDLITIKDGQKRVSNGSIVYLLIIEKLFEINALALLLGESVEWVKCYVSQVSPDRMTWDEISNGPIEQLVNLNRC